MTDAVNVPTPYMVEQCRKLLQPLAGNDWPKVARQAYALMTAAAPKAEPVSVAQRMASDNGLKIGKDIHDAFAKLIYGLPDYLNAENLTDEERVIQEAHIALDATAHRIAHLELHQPEAPKVEQEPVGAAEVEVGRAVYLRIESLIALNPKPNTSEWSELTYLSYLTGCVEELGAFDGPTVPLAPASDELLKVVEHPEKLLRAICDAPQPKYVEGHLYKAINNVNVYVAGLNAQHKGPQS